MTAWLCPVCGYKAECVDRPKECPLCRQPGATFDFVDNDEAYLDELDEDDEMGE